MKELPNERELELKASKSEYKVDKFSRGLKVSCRQLHRLFNKTLNVSPKQWLFFFKMKQARKLLSQGRKIYDVASKLKYTQSAHFIRDYKKSYGVTPALDQRRNSHRRKVDQSKSKRQSTS